MRVVQEDLWLCTDCVIAACNGDTSGVESVERVQEIIAGLEALGPYLVPDFDSEADEDTGIDAFSRTTCDCCGEWRAGERHRFAVLGD